MASEEEQQSSQDLHSKWKQMAFLGPLPSNFLKISPDPADQNAAAFYQQLQNYRGPYSVPMGRLSVTITQAKLVKNYGLSRMDPYVRLRVGHAVYETHTDINGGKNPHWNKHFQCFLPPGVKQIYIEIFDECSFTMDELIAWGYVNIPTQVLENGATHEDWYMLSGKQGENQEGMINIILSYNQASHIPPINAPAIMLVPDTSGGGITNPYGYNRKSVNVYTTPQINTSPPTLPSASPNSEEELKQIAEMFPNIDKEVINSVYDINRGNKAETINYLLQINE